MTRLDDRIRDGLQGTGPAAPDLGALTDEITRRRHHRDTVRRVQMGGLTVVVVAATVVGYMTLSRAFTGSDDRVPASTDFGSNGMVVSCPTDVPGLHLCRVPVDAIQGGVAAGDVVPLTEQPGETVMNPSVSPDGRTIVFDRVEADGSFELWRIGIDGTGERLLLEDVADGSWSPDGDSIVAVADGDGDRIPETLVVLGPDGDLGSSVSGYLNVMASPSYSPDGDAIVIAGEDGEERGIYIITGEGRPRLLRGSDGASSYPIWMDADAVLYVANADAGDTFRIQDLDGATRDEFPVGLQPVDRPSLSPDGSSIAFETVSTADEPAVAMVPVGGGDASIVLPAAAFPAWVPAAAPSEPVPDQAVRIAGVPFPACHPMTIPGSFGDGLDTLWVIEREHEVADGDCSAAEGFQYVGVGTAAEVRILSDEIGDIGQGEAALWPFAVPDIDDDGIDEIGIGLAGSRAEGYARIALYRVIDGAVTYVAFDCGPACRPAPWIGLGSFVEGRSGAYCGPEGFVRWSTSEGRVVGNIWTLENASLVIGGNAFDRADTGADYPADGMSELCGSPTTFPEDFANYPDEPDGSPTQEPPVVEGDDIGIEKNVCALDSKGGLDIVPGGDRETAWTGYLVTDAGTCPERNPERQTWIVAVDATGDGVADTWTEVPLINCPNVACFPLDATDLDGDGDGELIVSTSFSIMDQAYFAIDAGDGGFAIRAIEVAAPGHPAAGIAPGAALETSSGGDAGYGAWIRCENHPAAPILVFTYVSSIVGSEQPHEWHEVKLQLQGDGMFHVVDATDLSLPPGQDPGLIRSEAPACGVDFWML